MAQPKAPQKLQHISVLPRTHKIQQKLSKDSGISLWALYDEAVKAFKPSKRALAVLKEKSPRAKGPQLKKKPTAKKTAKKKAVKSKKKTSTKKKTSATKPVRVGKTPVKKRKAKRVKRIIKKS